MNLNKDGIIGTTIFHVLVAILLIFFGFSYPDPPPEEEGILVNFGTDFTGYGDVEPAGDETQGGEQETVPEEIVEEPVPEVQEQAPAQPVQEQIVEEQVQDFEESPVKENKPTPEEIRQQKIEAEKRRLEELEKERQRQAELERQRIEKEKAEKATRLKKMGESAFGNKGVGTGSESQGEAGGAGNQGSLGGTPGVDNYGDGGGLGDGISYGLGDRKGRGSWPKPFIANCEDVTGRIIIKVQIDVDSEGNVVGDPLIAEATYLDDCITKAVIKAARMAKFTSADKFRQRGWIRYIIDP
jgi:colicin import membrane protein